MRANLLSLSFLLCASCVGSAPPRSAVGEPIAQTPLVVDHEVESDATFVPFASTPITPVAEALTRVALRAALGGPIDTPPVPTRRPVMTSAAEVDFSPRIQGRPRDLEVLGFAFELEVVLKRGEPPDVAEGPARWGSLRATLALSRNGLRLVELRPRAMEADPEGGTIPRGFEGLDRLIARLLDDIRRADLADYALDETDRALLDNDVVWSRVGTDFSSGQIDLIQQMLLGLPHEPLAVRLDDVSVLVRDERERLFSLGMDFDPYAESYVLATAPLVQVTQLWPAPSGARTKALDQPFPD